MPDRFEELSEKIGRVPQMSRNFAPPYKPGIGTAKISFDILLNVLRELGFDFKIVPKRVA